MEWVHGIHCASCKNKYSSFVVLCMRQGLLECIMASPVLNFCIGQAHAQCINAWQSACEPGLSASSVAFWTQWCVLNMQQINLLLLHGTAKTDIIYCILTCAGNLSKYKELQVFWEQQVCWHMWFLLWVCTWSYGMRVDQAIKFLYVDVNTQVLI